MEDPGGENHSGRIRRELETLRAMLLIFCQNHHGEGRELCPGCVELWDYARARVEHCPFGRGKPTCANCTVHCFRPEMRERIKEVMRYSGPKMPLKHPLLAIMHFIDGRKPTPEKKRPKA